MLFLCLKKPDAATRTLGNDNNSMRHGSGDTTLQSNLITMAKVRGAITVNIERCKGCNLCVVACPTNTLALQAAEVNDRGYHYAYMANPENCTGCCSCAWVCPDACIEVYRVKVEN